MSRPGLRHKGLGASQSWERGHPCPRSQRRAPALLFGGVRDEAVLVCVDEQAEASAFYVELVIYYREVIPHGRLGDDGAKALCDLFFLEPIADERDYLALALVERVYLRGLRVYSLLRAHAPFKQAAGRARFQPVV